jgi:hypothetical protein
MRCVTFLLVEMRSSSNSNAKFVGSIGMPYLMINEVIRNGVNVTMKLASYDKFGAVYISAEFLF